VAFAAPEIRPITDLSKLGRRNPASIHGAHRAIAARRNCDIEIRASNADGHDRGASPATSLVRHPGRL